MTATTSSSARSLDELKEIFDSKLSALEIGSDILGAGDYESIDTINNCKRQLKVLHETILSLKCEVRESKESLSKASQLLLTLSLLREKAEHVFCNLPTRLPGQMCSERPKPNLLRVESEPTPAKFQPTFAQFDYITTEEFNQIPKYLRGRLQYEQINKVVDDMNETLQKKYTLLKKKRKNMSITEAKLVNSLRDLNTEQTKGLHFITAEDIKRWSVAKYDNSYRAILTLLRTAKRCQEVRGSGGVVRYAVPQ